MKCTRRERVWVGAGGAPVARGRLRPAMVALRPLAQGTHQLAPARPPAVPNTLSTRILFIQRPLRASPSAAASGAETFRDTLKVELPLSLSLALSLSRSLARRARHHRSTTMACALDLACDLFRRHFSKWPRCALFLMSGISAGRGPIRTIQVCFANAARRALHRVSHRWFESEDASSNLNGTSTDSETRYIPCRPGWSSASRGNGADKRSRAAASRKKVRQFRAVSSGLFFRAREADLCAFFLLLKAGGNAWEKKKTS